MKLSHIIIVFISIGAILIVIGIILYGYSTPGVSRDTIVNETFHLDPGSYRWYCTPKIPFEADRVAIYINVLSGYGGISFYAMAESDLKDFRQGKSFYYYPQLSREDVIRTVIEWRRPPTFQYTWIEGDRMCYVYDNRYSLSPKTVETWITYEYEVNEHPFWWMEFMAIPGFLLLASGLVIVVTVSISKLASKKTEPP